MKKLNLLLLLLIPCISAFTQDKKHPVIESYGGVFDVPEATATPDPDITYRVVITVSSGPRDNQAESFQLDRVARTVNLHCSDDTPVDMDLKVVAYAGGITPLLSNEAYNKKYGVDNPNAALIDELVKKGVQILVCGQSIRYMGIDHTELYPGVEVATSYITALTTFEMKGYSSLSF